MKKEIIIIGAGGHSKSCIDIIELEGNFKIKGLIGLKKELGIKIFEYSVIGEEKDLIDLYQVCSNAFIAIGQIKSYEKRKLIYNTLIKLGFKLPSIISPNSYVSPNASIGDGTIIMHGATVNAGAKIGKNSIINTNSLVEHDANIGNHCHISTGAIINGSSVIEDCTFIGSGSIINNDIRIGRESIIGSSVNIYKNQANLSKVIK